MGLTLQLNKKSFNIKENFVIVFWGVYIAYTYISFYCVVDYIKLWINKRNNNRGRKMREYNIGHGNESDPKWKRGEGEERGRERGRFFLALNTKVEDLVQKGEKILANMKEEVSEVRERNEQEVKSLDWRVVIEVNKYQKTGI